MHWQIPQYQNESPPQVEVLPTYESIPFVTELLWGLSLQSPLQPESILALDYPDSLVTQEIPIRRLSR